MVKTIAGPFVDRKQAEETANAIGANCSAFGIQKTDSEGYCMDECDWYVEQDDSIFSGKIFGYEASQFMARQYK
jgi:hypothetical protein